VVTGKHPQDGGLDINRGRPQFSPPDLRSLRSTFSLWALDWYLGQSLQKSPQQPARSLSSLFIQKSGVEGIYYRFRRLHDKHL
jgi:hypothetical protein